MSDDTDVRLTPEWLLAVVREYFGGPIELDPCNHPSNPTQALVWCAGGEIKSQYALTANGLEHPWDRATWCNPPYSDIRPWAEKAVREARLGGGEILLLTPDDCRTRWHRYLADNADARCRIRRGVGFKKFSEDGVLVPMPGPRWGSCVWYWGWRRRRFERVFGAIGEVTHLLGPQEE